MFIYIYIYIYEQIYICIYISSWDDIFVYVNLYAHIGIIGNHPNIEIYIIYIL